MPVQGLHLITPSSVTITGTSSSISANGSVSFTSCSIVRLADVFTTAYDNYMIVGRSNNGSASGAINILLGNPGTSTSGYSYGQYEAAGTAKTSLSATSLSSAQIGDTNANGTGFILYLYSPKLARATVGRSLTSGQSSTNPTITEFAISHTTATAYADIRFDFPVATSGRITVYGMRR
jgi:hypothetical protein